MDATIEILLISTSSIFMLYSMIMNQIQKIISGGQTGVDQAALRAATASGLQSMAGVRQVIFVNTVSSGQRGTIICTAVYKM